VDLPGGFVDLGESVEQAAERETMEELELAVELQGLLGIYSRPDDRVVLIVFRARALGVPKTTPEAPEVRASRPTPSPTASSRSGARRRRCAISSAREPAGGRRNRLGHADQVHHEHQRGVRRGSGRALGP
jgi:ADP-ribose pyrophosphatase YjhB (NUDIX family)